MAHATAQVEHRPRGGVDHARRFRDRVHIHCRRRIRLRRRRQFFKRDELVLHILGHIHQHRPGPAGHGDTEGFRNHRAQFAGAAHQEVVLGDRHGDAVDIHFLKGVGADHRARHLAGDRHQRNRIEMSVGDGSDEIGRPRPAGRDADLGRAADARHALGDEARALLVAGKHVADLAAHQRIVERQDGAARNARDGAHTLAFEKAHEQLCAADFFHEVLLVCSSGA